MKVRELIEQLQKCNPELEVVTEGCDCYGDVGFVDETYLEGRVFLARSNGSYGWDKSKEVNEE